MIAPSFANLLRILQISTACVFLGRAWQHLYWDAPYRTLFWDEQWMGVLVEHGLKMEWGEYVTGGDAGISALIQGIGAFYLLCAIAAFTLPSFPKVSRIFLLAGGCSLIFLAFLYTKEKFFLLPQFLEYSLQFGSPFLLLAFYGRKVATGTLVTWTKLAIAFTFTAHGIFALGVFPTPGYFVEMVMLILGVGEPEAIVFLKIAGGLDLILSILLFFPRWLSLPALAYAICWGFGTTLARVWAYSRVMDWDHLLLQWLHESVMRVPHFLIPLFLLLFLWKRRSDSPAVPPTKAT